VSDEEDVVAVMLRAEFLPFRAADWECGFALAVPRVTLDRISLAFLAFG
jgi:hypothetical protein